MLDFRSLFVNLGSLGSLGTLAETKAGERLHLFCFRFRFNFRFLNVEFPIFVFVNLGSLGILTETKGGEPARGVRRDPA